MKPLGTVPTAAWLAEYRRAFMACAAERGWTEDDATLFCSDLMADLAHTLLGDDVEPAQSARTDVLEIEVESDDA